MKRRRLNQKTRVPATADEAPAVDAAAEEAPAVDAADEEAPVVQITFISTG